jgi:hypothetical protein
MMMISVIIVANTNLKMQRPVGVLTHKKKYFTKSQDVLPVMHPA